MYIIKRVTKLEGRSRLAQLHVFKMKYYSDDLIQLILCFLSHRSLFDYKKLHLVAIIYLNKIFTVCGTFPISTRTAS